MIWRTVALQFTDCEALQFSSQNGVCYLYKAPRKHGLACRRKVVLSKEAFRWGFRHARWYADVVASIFPYHETDSTNTVPLEEFLLYRKNLICRSMIQKRRDIDGRFQRNWIELLECLQKFSSNPEWLCIANISWLKSIMQNYQGEHN